MKGERKLAYLMLSPTAAIVFGIVLFPLFINFWISFKPVKLADLRPPRIFVNEIVRGEVQSESDSLSVEYRLRNGSRDKEIRDAGLRDVFPPGLTPVELDPRCSFSEGLLNCELGDYEARFREKLKLNFAVGRAYLENPVSPKLSKPEIFGDVDFVLTSFDFVLDNFRTIFDSDDVWFKFYTTFFYTFVGTLGALILGLFAAQLLNVPFRGRALLRGLFLFPYVSPVIAVAFTWVYFLDPFSGFINSLLKEYGLIEAPINFLGTKTLPVQIFGFTFPFPLALVTVTIFEIWRYFPLAFLFILARMQALSKDVFEAARVDGASPLQQFFHISLPQLLGIIGVLFLLRFIWTFNKFDDIYLMTGGASGTTTLTVDVYKQAFALSDLGAGAAMAVIIFLLLAVFVAVQIKFTSGENL